MTFGLSRRRLLAMAAAGAAPWPGPDGAAADATAVTLVAGRRSLEVNGRAASVYGITGPDGAAGLVTAVGRDFRVRLHNGIGEPTLLHWYGLTPPWQQDGVPDIAGPPVPPGSAADYAFPLAFPGTFWMQALQGLQAQQLMAAPLIVADPRDPADVRDVVVMLHDFSFRDAAELLAGLRSAPPGEDGRHLAGARDAVAYDAFLANDRTLADPAIVRVDPGSLVRLRIVNASASTAYHVGTRELVARLVAVDGHPVHPVAGSLFPVAVGQRLDLLLQLPPVPAVIAVLAQPEGLVARTGVVLATPGAPVGRIPEGAGRPAPPLDLALESRLLPAGPGLQPRPVDRSHVVELTGPLPGYRWRLGGDGLAYDRPLPVATGERVELVLRNRTGSAHPLHLHGHVVQVVGIDGLRFAGACRDTVLVPPRTTVTVAFDADNPGWWALRSSNLFRMTAGMMTSLRYAGS